MIFYAIFDGQPGGDWWALFDNSRKILGTPRLKDISYLLGGSVLHQHSRKPCPDKIPNLLLDNFYADTIRWCKPKYLSNEILRKVHLRRHWFDTPLSTHYEYMACHKNGKTGVVFDIDKRFILQVETPDGKLLGWAKDDIVRLSIIKDKSGRG